MWMLTTVNHGDDVLDSVCSFSASGSSVFKTQAIPRKTLGISLGLCLENGKIVYGGSFQT